MSDVLEMKPARARPRWKDGEYLVEKDANAVCGSQELWRTSSEEIYGCSKRVA